MFPVNLHQNILQLDKQLTVLEKECQNMSLDSKKKIPNQNRVNTCSSKSSNLYNKSSSFNNVNKKTVEDSKRIKKLSPAPSSRVYSTSSLPSNGSKQCSRVSDSKVFHLVKQIGQNSNNFLRPSQGINNKSNSHSNSSKQNTISRCGCNKELSESKQTRAVAVAEGRDALNVSSEKNSNCIIHKEVVFSDSGGTIEVTVKQKSNCDSQKENLLYNKAESDLHNVENCGCQVRKKKSDGQKWSEILSVVPVKESDVENCRVSNVVTGSDRLKATCSSTLEGNNGREVSSETRCNGISGAGKQDLIPPMKLEQPKAKKQLSDKEGCHNNAYFPQKKISLEEFPIQFSNSSPLPIFQLLIDELKEKSSEDGKKKLLNEMEIAGNKILYQDPRKSIEDVKVNKFSSISKSQNDVFLTIQKLCDNLLKEKDSLTKELDAKNKIIETFKTREEEYLSLISSLKSNLEKAKGSAKNNLTAMKELDGIKEKLAEQVKISEVLKTHHIQLKEAFDKCTLENDRLKTEIRIYKLESQKHDILMAGKEAEIKRYREEIGNFQRQIGDHLASIKSNAQVIDMKKMMEAIIRQSQIFTQDDGDSVAMEAETSLRNLSSKHTNKLMHSSPNSTKTSDINSSWKQISSIRDQEQQQPPPQTDPNESDSKKFYQVYGGDVTTDSRSSKHSFKKPIENSFDRNQMKSSSNFTSCQSVELTDEETIKTEREVFPGGREEKKMNDSSKKIKTSIDQLLKDMKLKWSEELYGTTSPDDGSVEDFLNGSQVSSISALC